MFFCSQKSTRDILALVQHTIKNRRIYAEFRGCVIMKNKYNGVFEWLQMIIVALVLALLIENFLFGFAVVEGRSMEPTIHGSDRLFVMKLAYLKHQPEMGDIVVFRPPNSAKRNEMFIKRVIAKANDHFIFRDGELYINGEKLDEDYVFDEEYIERVYPFSQGIVPEGMVFVLGDNRNDSNDSRTFGFIEADRIKGKVIMRVWPLDDVKAFIGGK